MGPVIKVSVRPAPHAVGRSALATVEIMVGVTLAHTWAGGSLPSAPWLVGVAGVLFGASVLATTGRAPLRWMLLGVGTAQLGLHAFLTTAAVGHGHAHAATRGHAEMTSRMLTAHAISAVITAVVWHLRRRVVDSIVSWQSWSVDRPAALRSRVTGDLHHFPKATWWELSAAPRGPPRRCRA